MLDTVIVQSSRLEACNASSALPPRYEGTQLDSRVTSLPKKNANAQYIGTRSLLRHPMARVI